MELQHTLRLDRSYYSKNSEIFQYCTQEFGSCQDDNPRWDVYTMFGYTYLSFCEEADLNQFKKWVDDL